MPPPINPSSTIEKPYKIEQKIHESLIDSESLKESFTYLQTKGILPKGVQVTCIDGRRTSTLDDYVTESEPNVVAIPGGGLGLLMDAHSSVEFVLGEEMNTDVENQVLEVTRKFLNEDDAEGKISAHTDDHAEGVFFAGCGHCLGIQNDMPKYNTPKKLIDFVANLQTRNEQIFDTEIFSGSHAEEAVVVLNNPEKTLPSLVGKKRDSQVFVYSSTWHQLMIQKLSEKLSSEILSLNGKEKDIESAFKSLVAIEEGSRAHATVHRLALSKDLPVITID